MRLAFVVAVAGALGPAVGAAQTETWRPRPGLQLTYVAVNRGEPDYEAILAVTGGDTAEMTVRWAWNRGTARRWQQYQRPLSARERRLAKSFYMYSRELDARQYRGTTPAMLSGALFTALRAGNEAEAVLLEPGVSPVPFRGTLTRVGTATESFKTMVDGTARTVPAVRVKGRFGGPRNLDNEFLVLDDPAAPWILWLRTSLGGPGADFTVQLGRLDTGAESSGVAGRLEADCRATLRGIYFATGSDEIDSTSAPALGAIRGALASHPDWRITVVGHTDSIGAAPANLDLSRRRAERVRLALVEGGVAGTRLAAAGKGEAEPTADNATVEGRAANRRVELVRSCLQR